MRDEAFLPSAHALANPVPVDGNRIEILENGVEIFPAMLSAIAAAQSTINLETYIFWSGEIATRFRRCWWNGPGPASKSASCSTRSGHPSKLDDEDVRAMREAGCVVELYHPLRPWMLDAINNRTHRRILVVDGKVGFTGGAGIADVWLGDADAPDHWRETHVRMEGPVVAELQAVFQENWAEVRGEPLLGAKHFPRLERVGTARSQVITSSARSTSSSTKLLYAVSISSASERLLISNSYFLPDGETVALLVDAARRGVNVRIIVPGKINDVPATKAAGRARFGDLLRGGVKIFEYRPRCSIPRPWSWTGSSRRSARPTSTTVPSG